MTRLLARSARLPVLALACAVLLGCGASREPRILFVVLDAARPDRFGVFGSTRGVTPNMDALAARGAAFSNHFAHGMTTRATLPKLLFSRYFSPPLFPSSTRTALANPDELFQALDRQAISLPAALAEAGYHTAAISAHSWLREGSAFAREFDELHDLSTSLDYPRRYAYPRAEQVIDYTIQWLEEQDSRRQFLYLHLMDTHFPHFYDSDAQDLGGGSDLKRRVSGRFRSSGVPRDRSAALVGDDREFLDALYDGSLRYADRHLGRLFAHLEETGVLDEMLVVITSDHGENLLEVAERFDHGGNWYDAVARIPLIVFYPPGMPTAHVAAVTEAIDVAPTVLDLAGVDLPEEKHFDGRSLVPMASEPTAGDQAAFSLWGVRTADRKLLFRVGEGSTLRQALTEGDPSRLLSLGGELYTIADDPLETTNLWDSEPNAAAELIESWSDRLERPYRRFVAARRKEPPPTSFAIAAKSFHLEAAQPVRAVGFHAGEELDPALAVWQHDRHWRDYELYGAPGAGTVQISFPLPNGTYRVEASFSGRCTLRVSDSEELELDGATDEATIVTLGETTVIDERFRALLAPAGGACRLLHFGFEPGDVDPDAVPADREEYERRLEALGYVN